MVQKMLRATSQLGTWKGARGRSDARRRTKGASPPTGHKLPTMVWPTVLAIIVHVWGTYVLQIYIYSYIDIRFCHNFCDDYAFLQL